MPGILVPFRTASTGIKTAYITVGIFALVFLVICLVWISRSQTFINATTHQPETFTELYFSSPNSLPQTVIAGESVPVKFTVHNVEARAMTYTYDVSITLPSGQQTTLLQNQLGVADGQTKQVGANITLPAQTGRYEITVALKNNPDVIHYWTEKTS